MEPQNPNPPNPPYFPSFVPAPMIPQKRGLSSGWRAVIIAASIVLVVVCGACVAALYGILRPPDTVKIGVSQTHDSLVCTVISARPVALGNLNFLVTVRLHNTDSSKRVLYEYTAFGLVTTQFTEAPVDPDSPDWTIPNGQSLQSQALRDAFLAPGQEVTGVLGFEIRAGETPTQIVWAPEYPSEYLWTLR
ncbi:MAG TPA: hypothetical protein VFY89_00495 [Ktedonobacterales bacterium]